MRLYTTKEVISLLKISPRNLKFWIKEYNLKPEKKGKVNYFNEVLFEQLKIINYFSNNNYFTGKLLAIYLNEISENSTMKFENEKNKLKEFIKNLGEIEKELNKKNLFLSLLTDEIKVKEVKEEEEESKSSERVQQLKVELL
ncbi:MAG TPA: MerR family transcriptional regulator [bacterium]|nr:MerR family transcriptional regulator [bacterium]HOL48458.1 MerR family transcriptional regulator [bacterium]HPQ19964.1 MerR family transcriptional regulator [bacterium]